MSSPLAAVAHQALALTEPAFLRHYGRGRFAVVDGVAYTGSELPGPGFNFAACLRPCPPLAAVLPTARDFFAADGWGVLVEGDAGHPVEAALQAAGWAVAEDEPAYVRPDLVGVAPGSRPDGLVVRPVATEADRLAVVRVCTAAYEAPPELADLIMPSLAFARDPAMCWLLAERDGQPVACGGACHVAGVAVVCCLATLAGHRGRGYGAAVLRGVLADAARRGCTAAALRSGPASVPLYERHGFRYACRHRTYAAPAGS